MHAWTIKHAKGASPAWLGLASLAFLPSLACLTFRITNGIFIHSSLNVTASVKAFLYGVAHIGPFHT